MFDSEVRTRVRDHLGSDELNRYKANVDRFFDEVAPSYRNASEALGEHLDDIRADPALSERFDSATAPLNNFREQHRELMNLTLSLTPTR